MELYTPPSVLLYVHKIKIQWRILPIPFPHLRLFVTFLFLCSYFIFSLFKLNESVLRISPFMAVSFSELFWSILCIARFHYQGIYSRGLMYTILPEFLFAWFSFLTLFAHPGPNGWPAAVSTSYPSLHTPTVLTTGTC